MSDIPPAYSLLCDSGPASTAYSCVPLLQDNNGLLVPGQDIKICGKAHDTRASALRIFNNHGQACIVTGICYDINSPCKPVMPEKPVRGVVGTVASLRFENTNIVVRGHKVMFLAFFQDPRCRDVINTLYLDTPLESAATAKQRGGCFLGAAIVPHEAMQSLKENGFYLTQTFVAPGCTVFTYPQPLQDIGAEDTAASAPQFTNAASADAAAGAAHSLRQFSEGDEVIYDGMDGVGAADSSSGGDHALLGAEFPPADWDILVPRPIASVALFV